MVSVLLSACLGTEMTLVWSDEFNVDGPPDPGKWIYELGFVRNKEPQLYRKENVWVKDGFLVIEGRKEEVPNPAFDPAAPADDWKKSRKTAPYTSGSIKTATLHTWTYGRFECRGKFKVTKGLWPAFWMTGPARAWPANGEIDIMEFYQGQYLANLAWGSSKPGVGIWNTSKTQIEKLAKESGYESAEAWADDFHVYRMDWDQKWIRLYVDNRLLNEQDLTKTINQSPDGANPFHEPHHLILNLALGATGGDPKDVKWPTQFVVDWVRVWQ
ncbi:MAG: glycoside hydrolase family 16 protein [Armatimonadetes bacterium]|nr:glycoside hydrolase family 16 protein [Armatimonadota bacterium]